MGLPDDAVVVIAVGRNDPMKNWPGMLAAADAAADRNVWLVAVGDGTERLPPAPRRRLLGRRDDMPALYAAADIFMLASHFGEGTSVALSEAMASGLPVVVTEVGDNGAVVGDAGLVVPPRDAAALAQALSTLAGDPACAPHRQGRAAAAVTLRHRPAARELSRLLRALSKQSVTCCGRPSGCEADREAAFETARPSRRSASIGSSAIRRHPARRLPNSRSESNAYRAAAQLGISSRCGGQVP